MQATPPTTPEGLSTSDFLVADTPPELIVGKSPLNSVSVNPESEMSRPSSSLLKLKAKANRPLTPNEQAKYRKGSKREHTRRSDATSTAKKSTAGETKEEDSEEEELGKINKNIRKALQGGQVDLKLMVL